MSSFPVKQLKVVVLPAPLTPKRLKHSPVETPKDVPFTALVPFALLLP